MDAEFMESRGSDVGDNLVGDRNVDAGVDMADAVDNEVVHIDSEGDADDGVDKAGDDEAEMVDIGLEGDADVDGVGVDKAGEKIDSRDVQLDNVVENIDFRDVNADDAADGVKKAGGGVNEVVQNGEEGDVDGPGVDKAGDEENVVEKIDFRGENADDAADVLEKAGDEVNEVVQDGSEGDVNGPVVDKACDEENEFQKIGFEGNDDVDKCPHNDEGGNGEGQSVSDSGDGPDENTLRILAETVTNLEFVKEAELFNRTGSDSGQRQRRRATSTPLKFKSDFMQEHIELFRGHSNLHKALIDYAFTEGLEE